MTNIDYTLEISRIRTRIGEIAQLQDNLGCADDLIFTSRGNNFNIYNALTEETRRLRERLHELI